MTPISPADSDTPDPDICPDPELLASYIDGLSTPDERAAMEAHLAKCEACQFVHSETILARDGVDLTVDPRVARFGRRPLIQTARRAVAGLAAAAALVIAVQTYRTTAQQRERERVLTAALSELEAADGAYRKYEPRLSVASTYRPLRPPVRSGSTPGATLTLRSAAVEVERRSREDALRSEERRALAAMYLTLGQLDRATGVVVPAANESSDAALLNDAAATLLVRNSAGDAERSVELLEQALAREPGRPEPLFNLGLAAESAGDVGRAQLAWRQYLSADLSSQWAAEAREHLERLSAIATASDSPATRSADKPR